MSPDEDGSQGDEGDIGIGTFDGGGRYYGKSVSGSVAPATMLEQVCFPIQLYSSHTDNVSIPLSEVIQCRAKGRA